MNNEEQNNSLHQHNSAVMLRNAGRDYHEHFTPASIKQFLATSFKAELDRIALDNSRLFRYRFGFEPNTLVRRQILTIQNQHDYSDRDMRWLRQSGQLSISHDSLVTLKPIKMIPFVGWTQMALLSIVCTALIFQFGNVTAPDWRVMLEQVLTGTFWFCGAWLLNRLYFAPWRIMKRSDIID